MDKLFVPTENIRIKDIHVSFQENETAKESKTIDDKQINVNIEEFIANIFSQTIASKELIEKELSPLLHYIKKLEEREKDQKVQIAALKNQLIWTQAASRIQAQARGVSERRRYVKQKTFESMGTKVLGHYVLKSDRFPDCHQLDTPNGDHAPNFRRLSQAPVYGSAQPDEEGLHIILDQVARDGYKHVIWINLREEAVLFVDGKPFTARRSNKLNENDLVPGVTGHTIQVVENSLKKSLIQSIEQGDGQFYYWNESSLHENELAAKTIQSNQVCTLPETFDSLKHPFIHSIQYHRIPIERENAPKHADLENIVKLCKAATITLDTAIIFNCQMGRGRTTTAMVIAALLWSKHTIKMQELSPVLEESITENLFDGNFRVIRALIKSLVYGAEAKKWVDQCINMNDCICNIRQIINEFREKSLASAKPAQRSFFLKRACNMLERYFYLIVFGSYLLSRESIDFATWLHGHTDLFRLLDDLGGVQYSHENMMKGCVLKYDHFPGIHHITPPLLGSQVPNFRQIASIPLYGVAQCTLKGMEKVIEHINHSNRYEKIVWINLREEAILFIRERPFVVRRLEHLQENIEYPGIEVNELHMIEDGLKKEIQTQVEVSNGFFLYWREVKDYINEETTEYIDPKTDIHTLSEVYEDLNIPDDIDVRYARIPVSDEAAPEEKDLDDLVRLLSPIYYQELKFNHITSAVICNCQMGRGRTTTALVCIYMLRHVIEPTTFNHQYHDKGKNPSEDDSLKINEIRIQATSPTTKYYDGNFQIIQQLIQILDNGKQSKWLTDEAIDACSEMQNLRECISQCHQQAHERNLSSERREFYFRRSKRYFYLICFASYLLERSSKSFDMLFVTWMNERYGVAIYELLDRLCFDEDDVAGTEEFSNMRWRWRRKRKLISRLE